MWKDYARIFFLHQKCSVRSGIRTHAHRSELRPEHSALDHSAILTTNTYETIRQQEGIFTPFKKLKIIWSEVEFEPSGTEVDWPLYLTVSPP